MSINDETIIIVEIPHQRSPLVWHSAGAEELIAKADVLATSCTVHQVWTKKEMDDCWADDDAPDDLAAIIEEHGSAVELHDGFYSPVDAPDELDAAQDYIGHDLRACYFLTIEEANDALQNPPWGFSPEANQALYMHLGEHHYLEEMEVEKIVEALEGLSKKEKLAALQDGDWLGNFSVNQQAIEGLYAEIEGAQ